MLWLGEPVEVAVDDDVIEGDRVRRSDPVWVAPSVGPVEPLGDEVIRASLALTSGLCEVATEADTDDDEEREAEEDLDADAEL